MKRITNTLFVSLIGACLLLVSCTKKQESTTLPRSIPEAEGVSSKNIVTFLDSVAASGRHELHSFMFLRHGKVIAEGWWNPYRPDLKHTLNSLSKSFTGTAIGLAAGDNKLSVDDKLVSFFPEYLPDTVSENLSELKIKNLLSMAVGLAREPSSVMTTKNDPWVKTFMAQPVVIKPGTRYMYNSSASYMLSAIVTKVTGQPVLEYLTPRLFEPLGIEGADWESDPEGISTGGWGLRLKTEDLAKFGQLYLQKGKWNGKQLLPKGWVDEATSVKMQQLPDITQEKRDSLNDSSQGYCYQFWRAKHNSYQANGASGQFVVVMPEKDVVVVLTANSTDMWGEIGMIWDYLYPGIKDEALPVDEVASSELKAKLSSLVLPVPPEVSNNEMISKISGKEISLAENSRKYKGLSIQFNDKNCDVVFKTDTVDYNFSFATGNWSFSTTPKPGPSIFSYARNNQQGLPPFKLACAYTWTDDKTLELTLGYIENVQWEKIIMHFNENDNKVLVEFAITGTPPMRNYKVEGTLM
ncbi:MAG TPA: serine hydrolase [Bacteroidales bacterium]|nr:serine hydrolase [Bacteroidales bacterium]